MSVKGHWATPIGRTSTTGVNQERRENVDEEKTRTEEYRVTGDDLVAKAKELVHEGNIRRMIIKNEEGQSLIEIPLTLGVVGIVLLPVWAAIGALAALVADCTIVVEKAE
jgi:CBS domain-containing protein